jgi:hypothetical protein
MDSDDIAYPQRLERQVAWLQAHPEIDLLGAGMMVFEAEGWPVCGFPARATHAEICARPAAGFYLAHPTWIGKLEWFKRWRYDSGWLGAEDQDLLLRSFSASRFAAIPEPLLGYRQNVLSMRKSVRGRYYFSRSLLRAARNNGHILQGLRAVAEQAAKLGWEWIAISSGLSRTLLRHRALPFTPEQAQAWRAVWAACHDASCAVPEKPAAV